MNPTARVSVIVAAALVAGGVVGLAYFPAVSIMTSTRASCATTSTACDLLVRYPYRLPAIIGVVVLVGLAVVGVLVTRWALRPFGTLTEVLARMGPTNLGYRLGWPRRRDVLGRLGNELDATMDRIAAGYQSQKLFAANASHELRTPLAVQRTLIEVGLTETLSHDQLALLTRQLLTTNERNERVIDGLMVLAEVEQAPLVRTPQRLDLITEGVVETYRDRARQRNVQLTIMVATTTVSGERTLLERLVTNLVQNAIDYNLDDHGRVEVSVEAGRLSVINTGPTVPAEDVGVLFEPFRRGSADRLTHTGGAGLGLTITRAIADAHHAVITAVPGEGGGLRIAVDFNART